MSTTRQGLLAVAVAGLAALGGGGARAGDGRPAANLVDAYFERYWSAHGIVPAPPASDHELLRRATLDVIGRLPRPDEVRAFERSKDRAAKLDELCASDEAASFFADRWMRILLDYRLEETAPLKMSFPAFRQWLRQAYAKDASLRDVARELLSASGDYKKNPAVNFALGVLDPKEPPHELASRTTRVFLGVAMQCARCHDHPTEKITHDDFWAMTAFFTGIKPKARTTFDGFGVKLMEGPARPIQVPDVKTVVAPRFLDGRTPDDPATARAWLARTIVEDPRFPRAIVNRTWAQLMGRGFVEPLDRIGQEKPAAHAELLDALCEDFTKNGFSVRRLVKTIASSRPYQASCETVAGAPPEACASMRLKPQDPVQLLNTLNWTLDLDVFLKGFYEAFVGNAALPEVYRNDAVFRTYLFIYMQRLLAPEGSTPEQSRSTGSVRLALKLMNSKDLQGLVKVGWGRLAEIMKKESTPEGRLVEVFYTVLARPPTPEERTRYLATIEKKGGRAEAYEDVYWVLLNSTELFFNH